MKTTYTFLVLLLVSFLSFSQVGINTTSPDPSSILDVAATNKGMLLPRVALTNTGDTSTIPNPAISLLVYNTATSSDLSPGFYFWNGNAWNAISAESGGTSTGDDNWAITGNNIEGEKFLGTTNYTSLKFKVNNSQMALFHPQGGMALGYGAVANDNNAVAIGTNANANNNEATAIGASATASGFQSAAFGYNAKAITSNSTLALGNSSTASSYQATALGVNSKATTNNNTLAIGTNSMATGENSTAIGYNSNASAQNAVALGNGAVANNPNTLILGNNVSPLNWDATKVGIGTSNPTEKLEVKGNIKIDGTLKISDGTQGVGKILTSDANGNATWTTYPQMGNTAYADIYASSSQNLNPWNPINFGTTASSENITVNSNNVQVITAGTYRVTFAVAVEKTGGSDLNIKFSLSKSWNSNFIPGSTAYVFLGNRDKVSATLTKMVHFNAYEQLYIFTDTPQNSNVSTIADGTYLNIELVKAD